MVSQIAEVDLELPLLSTYNAYTQIVCITDFYAEDMIKSVDNYTTSKSDN